MERERPNSATILNVLKLFVVADLVFVGCFALAYTSDFIDELLLTIILLPILGGFLQLLVYVYRTSKRVRECRDGVGYSTDYDWHRQHENYLSWYTVTRLLLLLLFAFACVCKVANVHIGFALLHLYTVNKAVCLLMLLCSIAMAACAALSHAYHRRKSEACRYVGVDQAQLLRELREIMKRGEASQKKRVLYLVPPNFRWDALSESNQACFYDIIARRTDVDLSGAPSSSSSAMPESGVAAAPESEVQDSYSDPLVCHSIPPHLLASAGSAPPPDQFDE